VPAPDPMSLIRSLEVLNHDFVPPRLLCRESQYNELAMELKLMASGFPPPRLVLFGPSGTGKTVTMRKVLADLNAPHAYVVAEGSAFKTLAALANVLSRKRWGPGTTMLWREVDEALPKPCLVVIDEAEKFMVRDEKSDELLYMLLERPGTGLVLISNRVDLRDHIRDARVKSRFNARTIIFPPYRPDEIYAIAEDRLRMALKVGVEEVADEQALKLLAALAAQRGGDARYAIDVLREAVKLWIVRGGRITEDLVREASKRVESSYVVECLRELSSSHKLMLLAALTSKTVGEAYRAFHEMAKGCGLPLLSERRLRDLLSDLEMMGYLSVRREGRKYLIEPSRWLPQDAVEVLKRELFP